MCCKDYGHTASYCPKDPNIRTGEQPDDEIERVEQGLDGDKKYQHDAQNGTLKMLAEFAKFKNNNKDNNEKAGGQFIMSFDDYQYKIANTNILDMTIDNKDMKKIKKLDDGGSLSESSEEDEDDEDEDEEDNKEINNKKKEANQKLFAHDEICDMEDAQIVDVFKDVRDELEYNLLDIEEQADLAIKKKKNNDEVKTEN